MEQPVGRDYLCLGQTLARLSPPSTNIDVLDWGEPYGWGVGVGDEYDLIMGLTRLRVKPLNMLLIN